MRHRWCHGQRAGRALARANPSGVGWLYTGTGTANIYNAMDFRIAVHSNTADAWKDVVAVASNTAGRTLHPIAPVSARYVRLTLLRPNSFANPYNYATLREFEVFGW